MGIELEIEEIDETKAPPRRGGGGAWDEDAVKELVAKMVRKAKSEKGKKVFGLPTNEAYEKLHGGKKGNPKYYGYYLKNKLEKVLDDMGVEGYDIYNTNAGGKRRTIVNLAHASF